MGIEQNKRTALAFLESITARAPALDRMTDDAVFFIPSRGRFDKAAFKTLSDATQKRFKTPIRFTILAVTAEEDRVAVEATGQAEMDSGYRYRQDYHFLFRFSGDLIAAVHEHNNSLASAEAFRPADA